MPWMIQRATVPGKWLRPNHVRYIPRPTGSVLSTQEILDPSAHYPVLYHHLESSPHPKAVLICHAWIKERLYQEKWLRFNHVRYIPRPTGSVLSTQEILDPSVNHPVLYHHFESSPYPKADLICHPWFKELQYQENSCVPNTYSTFQDPQGLSYPHKKYLTNRSIIQYYTITLNRVLTQRQVSYAMHDFKSYCTRKMAASKSRTVHSKTHRVCPIHTRNIGPIGTISSTIPSPWIESLPKGRSHMPCMVQRATVPWKMAASESHAVHSNTHRVCPIHTRNIGPIGPITSTIPSPWIESLRKGRSDMPYMIQRATIPGK